VGSVSWLKFVVVALACWRVTHLLAAEDGPWDLVARLRRALGRSPLGRAMDCFLCASLWVAFPGAVLLAHGPAEATLLWFALSAATCLLERVTIRNSRTEESATRST
jgi:hypothetical protein